MDTINSIPTEIAAGIVQVQASIKRLAKSSENKYANYQYASIDAFLEAVGPLEAEAGIFILPEEESEEIIESQGEKNGKPVTISSLKIRWAFTIGHKSGALFGPLHRTVIVPAVGAQAFGSAQSYALKQFQRGLYKIPTGDNDDPDAQQPQQLPQSTSAGRGNGRKPQRPTAPPPPPRIWEDFTESEKIAHAEERIEQAAGKYTELKKIFDKMMQPGVLSGVSEDNRKYLLGKIEDAMEAAQVVQDKP